MKQKNNNADGADKELRRARDRFHSEKTQLAIRAAIMSTGVSVSDMDRITEQLAGRLRQFKHIDHFKAFREEVASWAGRQARLTITLRELLVMQPNNYDVTLLFTQLENYDGDEDASAIQSWATKTMKRKADAPSAVPTWFNVHRKIIYSGIWYELKSCMDLGVGGYHRVTMGLDGDFSRLYHPVVEDIASDVWLWVYEHAFELLDSEVPLHIRLWHKARKTAHLWKLDRLANRCDFVSLTTMDSKEETVDSLMENDLTSLASHEYRLLRRMTSASADDAASGFEGAFFGVPENNPNEGAPAFGDEDDALTALLAA